MSKYLKPIRHPGGNWCTVSTCVQCRQLAEGFPFPLSYLSVNDAVVLPIAQMRTLQWRTVPWAVPSEQSPCLDPGFTVWSLS